jgi:hypothetical protein
MMLSNFDFLAFNDIPGSDANDTLNEINLKINDKIKVVSSYYGTTRGKYIEALTSMDIEDGDMLIMFVTSAKRKPVEWPKGFTERLSSIKDTKKLTLSVATKVWRKNDPMEFLLERNSRKFFVTLLTVRGASEIVDIKAKVNVCQVLDTDQSSTPRIITSNGGAVISAFAHIENRTIEVLAQKVIASIKNKIGGLTVAISESDGCFSRRIKAIGKGQDDISFAMSIQ